MRPLTPLCLLLSVSAVLAATPARAAESYDNCAGTISSLPAVITGQGVWCVKADLSTAMVSGQAITVATNNVTIDCNGFKVGGLAAGENTEAVGVFAYSRANVTIRNCNVRGFYMGIAVSGSGHIIEDNRVEGSRSVAIHSNTDGVIIRRNLVMDTGGGDSIPIAIHYNGDSDILDNIITGIFPSDAGTNVEVYGIFTTYASESRIRGNALRGLTTLGHPGVLVGIGTTSTGNSEVIDNYLSAVPGPADMMAIYCGGSASFVSNNQASGFNVVTSNCPADAIGNQLH